MTPASFICPLCGSTSYHPIDIVEGFCAHCDDFTGEQVPPTVDPRTPTTHDERRDQ